MKIVIEVFVDTERDPVDILIEVERMMREAKDNAYHARVLRHSDRGILAMVDTIKETRFDADLKDRKEE